MDKKITQEPTAASVENSDLMLVVQNTTTLPETKSITVENLFNTSSKISSINSSISAIETELGTTPQGSYTDVATRLSSIT